MKERSKPNPYVQSPQTTQAPPPLPEPQQEEQQEYRSELIREYDEVQREAQVHEEKERKALEEVNPHEKYIDVVAHRSPKDKFSMTLVGRPIDLFKLENYMIFTMSPRTNISLMRYNEVKAWEEAQGYGRKGIVKKKRGMGGLLFLIIIIVIMLIVGVVMLMYGPQIIQSMSGMFGGLAGG